VDGSRDERPEEVTMALSDRVREVVASAVESLDVELYDLEHAGGVLRVTLDRPGGIDVDALADANRAISRALDAADPIPGAYTLEVTSPGLERALRTPAHWQRAVGERVKVKTKPHVEGERRLEGVVAAADGSSATLRLDDGTDQTVAIADVDRARTVFEWGPAPKPGGPKQPSKAGGRTKEAHT